MGEPAIGFDGRATPAVLAAMEANMVAHMSHLPSLLPDAVVVDGPDLVIVGVGVPSDTFNVVCGARLEPATADDRIAAAIAHLRAKRIPFAWWVGPVSRPPDLGERLLVQGLVDAKGELGMALDLAQLPAESTLPVGLEVRRVTSTEEVADFARAVAEDWEPPDWAVLDFSARAAWVALAPNFPARFSVGYLDGEPVATSECFLGQGVAGLYAVVTLPPARRRGIATAMTVAPLLDARAAGYRTATPPSTGRR